jgi:malate synthase
MAAQVPIRGDPRSQEAIEKVIADKKREASEGYQGAWVAHPGLVSVVMKVFADRSPDFENGNAPREVSREDLLRVPEPKVSEQAVRANIAVSLRYLESWLGGLGCVAINNLMEDTATVEICRAQIWQWIHHSTRLLEGKTISRELFRSTLREVTMEIRREMGPHAYDASNYKVAEDLLDKLTTSFSFPEFMTLLAYDHLE